MSEPNLSLFILLLIVFLLTGVATLAQEEVPSGTVIPIALNHTISSEKTKPGTAISGRVMQDVPLPNGVKIRKGSKVTGHVVDTRTGGPGTPSMISLVFDRAKVAKKDVPIKTDLRAVANFTDVEDAQLPLRSMGEGDSWSARTTEQIGGDTVYWGGGPVTGPMGVVGRPVTGTDSEVLVRLTPNPKGGCRGELSDRSGPQAMWVFSSNACGVYDLDDVAIAHSGRTEPEGLIEMSSTRGKVKVPSGSGMLLRVMGNDAREQTH